MSDIKYNTYQLPNISLIKAQLPTDIYNSIMSEVKEIQNYGNTRKWNHKLAGALEKEYELIKSRSSLVPFLIDMAKHHPTPHALYFSHAERTLPLPSLTIPSKVNIGGIYFVNQPLTS